MMPLADAFCTVLLSAFISLGYIAVETLPAGLPAFAQKVSVKFSLSSQIVTDLACTNVCRRATVPPPRSIQPTKPVHTKGHVSCPPCEAARREAMDSGQVREGEVFAKTAERWMAARAAIHSGARFIKPGTGKSYEGYIRALNRFYRDTPIGAIHIGMVGEYQRQRAAGQLGPPPCTKTLLTGEVCALFEGHYGRCKPGQAWASHEVQGLKVNQEVALLFRVLRWAGVNTTEMEELYEPYSYDEPDIPRALTREEQDLWLRTAASSKRWELVYWYSMVAFDSTASNLEMRGLRVGDINLHQSTIYIQVAHSKRKSRNRTIAIGPDAVWACERILDRARDLGSTMPYHYAFPFCYSPKLAACREQGLTMSTTETGYDVAHAMSNSGMKRMWNEVREASGLLEFRQHDCRHTAITRYAEAGVPIPVIMARAGHISRRMFEHYTQISLAAQRLALEAAQHGGAYGHAPKRPPVTAGKLVTGQTKYHEARA